MQAAREAERIGNDSKEPTSLTKRGGQRLLNFSSIGVLPEGPWRYRGSQFGRPPRASVFGPLSKALIVLSDAHHRVSGLRIIHLIRENPRFFCSGEPVRGLINEVANHSPAPICCNFVTAEQEIRSTM